MLQSELSLWVGWQPVNRNWRTGSRRGEHRWILAGCLVALGSLAVGGVAVGGLAAGFRALGGLAVGPHPEGGLQIKWPPF